MGGFIVAIDPSMGEPLDGALRIASSVDGLASGVKVGWGFLLDYGLDGLASLRDSYGGLLIADLKLADIAWVMEGVVERLEGLVDAVIAHAFPGFEGAIDGLSRRLDSMGVRLILVVSMSHPGSREVIDRNLEALVGVASRAGAWGVVAPATRPWIVSRVRELMPEAKILSPGVGAQGASPGDALCAGADYEIIGRAVTRSGDPRRALEEAIGQASRRGCM